MGLKYLCFCGVFCTVQNVLFYELPTESRARPLGLCQRISSWVDQTCIEKPPRLSAAMSKVDGGNSRRQFRLMSRINHSIFDKRISPLEHVRIATGQF